MVTYQEWYDSILEATASTVEKTEEHRRYQWDDVSWYCTVHEAREMMEEKQNGSIRCEICSSKPSTGYPVKLREDGRRLCSICHIKSKRG